MYIDNLTLVGIAVASTYLLMPFLFRREIPVVEKDTDTPVAEVRGRGQGVDPLPCLET
jgi:hypothetical protein